jgi:hypothetical protein
MRFDGTWFVGSWRDRHLQPDPTLAEDANPELLEAAIARAADGRRFPPRCPMSIRRKSVRKRSNWKPYR